MKIIFIYFFHFVGFSEWKRDYPNSEFSWQDAVECLRSLETPSFISSWKSFVDRRFTYSDI